MQAAESISSIDMSADVDRKAMVALLHQRLQQPDGQVERDLLAGGEVLDSQTLERWLRADRHAESRRERASSHRPRPCGKLNKLCGKQLENRQSRTTPANPRAVAEGLRPDRAHR